jgi:hypothetical protein
MGVVARTRRVRRSAVMACVALVGVHALHAQSAIQPEARLDVVGPRVYSWQPGVGLNLALGYYARLAGIVGITPQSDSRFIADRLRCDIIARVLLDPFREQRWALSLGGGVSIRRQTYLAAVLDLEGPELKSVLPALEIGVGGGARGGIILRHAMSGRR